MQQFLDKLVNLRMFYLLNNDYFAQILGVDLFGPPTGGATCKPKRAMAPL